MSMEEAKWTGLSDWLAGKGNEKVTPQQVREFLRENKVRVEVKELRDQQWSPQMDKAQKAFESVGIDFYISDEGTRFFRDKNGDEIDPEDFNKRQKAVYKEYLTGSDGVPTEHSKYQLPGASNYREVLVTLPVKSTPDQKKTPGQIAKELYGKDSIYDLTPEQQAEVLRRNEPTPEQLSPFRSSHFDEPNILVHLRLNDRTGPNGEKILFIEELQSDWGQQGKKKGFRTGDIDNLEKELRSLEQEREAIRLAHTEKYRHTRQTREEYDRLDIELNQRDASIRRLRDRINLARYGTPQAPFVTSTDAWVELGLKQAIRMAV